MNNEIKEILKILKKCEFGACITKHNSRVLLDYITNLQKENERIKEWKEDLLEENIKLEDIRKEAIEEINYMITNADITEISAIKLKQILEDKGEDKE